MGHLEAGVPILSGATSNTPALDVERWGKVLCRVQLPDNSIAGKVNSLTGRKSNEDEDEEWNFAMTDLTVCLYTDDGENCKLFPRRAIQMVDLEDTDEVVVKVSKFSYYLRKVLGTLAILAVLVGLDELFSGLYGAGALESFLPEDIYPKLSTYTSPWWLLVLLPILPVLWCLVGCCVPAPYADVFKCSKLTLVTGATTTTFRMDDSDLPNIQEFLDCPSGAAR